VSSPRYLVCGNKRAQASLSNHGPLVTRGKDTDPVHVRTRGELATVGDIETYYWSSIVEMGLLQLCKMNTKYIAGNGKYSSRDHSYRTGGGGGGKLGPFSSLAAH